MPAAALSATAALERLSCDVGAAAHLVADGDPLHAYLSMLAALPPEPAAWLEVLGPWLDDARHARGARALDRGHVAALGALAVVGLRTAGELAGEPQLAMALRAVARWCVFCVRPSLC